MSSRPARVVGGEPNHRHGKRHSVQPPMDNSPLTTDVSPGSSSFDNRAMDTSSNSSRGALPSVTPGKQCVPTTDEWQTQFFKTKICPYHIEGRCINGVQCRFAHTTVEVRPLPDLHRTKLCESYVKKEACTDASCPFAHDPSELRTSSHSFYKVTLCNFYKKGRCWNGAHCRFAHGVPELQGPPAILQKPTTPPPKSRLEISGEKQTGQRKNRKSVISQQSDWIDDSNSVNIFSNLPSTEEPQFQGPQPTEWNRSYASEVPRPMFKQPPHGPNAYYSGDEHPEAYQPWNDAIPRLPDFGTAGADRQFPLTDRSRRPSTRHQEVRRRSLGTVEHMPSTRPHPPPRQQSSGSISTQVHPIEQLPHETPPRHFQPFHEFPQQTGQFDQVSQGDVHSLTTALFSLLQQTSSPKISEEIPKSDRPDILEETLTSVKSPSDIWAYELLRSLGTMATTTPNDSASESCPSSTGTTETKPFSLFRRADSPELASFVDFPLGFDSSALEPSSPAHKHFVAFAAAVAASPRAGHSKHEEDLLSSLSNIVNFSGMHQHLDSKTAAVDGSNKGDSLSVLPSLTNLVLNSLFGKSNNSAAREDRHDRHTTPTDDLVLDSSLPSTPNMSALNMNKIVGFVDGAESADEDHSSITSTGATTTATHTPRRPNDDVMGQIRGLMDDEHQKENKNDSQYFLQQQQLLQAFRNISVDSEQWAEPPEFLPRDERNTLKTFPRFVSYPEESSQRVQNPATFATLAFPQPRKDANESHLAEDPNCPSSAYRLIQSQYSPGKMNDPEQTPTPQWNSPDYVFTPTATASTAMRRASGFLSNSHEKHSGGTHQLGAALEG